MKSSFFLIVMAALGINTIVAQDIPVHSGLDMMLINGEYDRLIDTCRQILVYDSLNPGVYYKMGLAYQNNLEDELSLACFNEAAKLDPITECIISCWGRDIMAKGNTTWRNPF